MLVRSAGVGLGLEVVWNAGMGRAGGFTFLAVVLWSSVFWKSLRP